MEECEKFINVSKVHFFLTLLLPRGWIAIKYDFLRNTRSARSDDLIYYNYALRTVSNYLTLSSFPSTPNLILELNRFLVRHRTARRASEARRTRILLLLCWLFSRKCSLPRKGFRMVEYRCARPTRTGEKWLCSFIRCTSKIC